MDMNTQNVAAAQKAGGLEGLSRQHTEVQNTVGTIGQYAQRSPAFAYGGVDSTPCLCVSTWEHSYLYDWKYNKRAFL